MHAACYKGALNPQLSTLKPQPSTLNSQPSTLNPQPSTLNPQPSTLNPQPSTKERGTFPRRPATALQVLTHQNIHSSQALLLSSLELGDTQSL